MRFAEEMLLLLLDEKTGYFIPIPEWKMSCALAGSVLIDLALEDRIDSDLEFLSLIDPRPAGDDLLDPVLREIVEDAQVHSPQYWVERAARRSDEISTKAIDRLEILTGIDLIGRTIGDAVRSSYRPPGSIRSVQRRPIPTVGLLGMLSSRTLRSGNLPKFMCEKSKELGPIFQINAGGRRLVVLAGAHLNRWVGRKGRLHLRTRDYLEAFQQEWGTARSIASLDGADHFRMRKAVHAGNSRDVIMDRMDELLAMARGAFAQWGIGKVIPGEWSCQRMIGDQVAQLSVSIVPSDILDDLLKFEYRALLVHVHGLLPRFLLRTPAMKRYEARVLELYAQIHASHTPAQRKGKRRDLVDDLMSCISPILSSCRKPIWVSRLSHRLSRVTTREARRLSRSTKCWRTLICGIGSWPKPTRSLRTAIRLPPTLTGRRSM